MYSLTAKIFTGRNLQLLLNAGAFYVGSLVAILLGDIPALFALAVYIFVHALLIVKSQIEWLFVLGVATIGVLVDTLWSYLGLIDFNRSNLLAPIWLVCLWFFFASTLCHSLQWFRPYPFRSALCAALAGPFSYFAGAALNEAELGQPLWRTLAIMSVYWAVLFPLLLRASAWVNNAAK